MANQSVEAYKKRLERVARAAGEAAYSEMIAGAREIGSAMKRAVPRRTGKLADSVRLETDPHHGRVWIKAGGPTTRTPQGTDYALHQEYGTSDTPANPFFWPMWRTHRKTVRAKMQRAMKKAIEAEMNKS